MTTVYLRMRLSQVDRIINGLARIGCHFCVLYCLHYLVTEYPYKVYELLSAHVFLLTVVQAAVVLLKQIRSDIRLFDSRWNKIYCVKQAVPAAQEMPLDSGKKVPQERDLIG